jgi:4-hydroxyphenylpyruvate dioxygenase-like putative hemolysin
MHHVVFCVHPENQDKAADMWRDLGFTFTELHFPDIGLRVLLDWGGGIEIISPSGPGQEAEEVGRFLAEHGEGIYSVVVTVADLDSAVTIAERHGARSEYRQDRSQPGIRVLESRHSPVHGMPASFLETSLGPDDLPPQP